MSIIYGSYKLLKTVRFFGAPCTWDCTHSQFSELEVSWWCWRLVIDKHCVVKCAHDIDCCKQSSGETCRHVEQIVAVRCSETTTTDQSAFSWRLWQPSRRSLSYVSRCTGVLRWRDNQPVYCVSGNFHPSWASSGSTATAWHVTRRLQVATLLLLCSYFTGLPLQLMCTY